MSWIHITQQDFTELVESATPTEFRKNIAGFSPGYVAARLGVSRSAVHQAIDRGKLDAYRVTQDGKLVSIYVTERSLKEYEQSDSRQKHTPHAYRQTA